MNACLQCLHRVPELRAALQAWAAGTTGAAAGGADTRLSAGLARLFRELDAPTSTDVLALHTTGVLAALRQANPRFAETQQGHAVQQVCAHVWSLFGI